ncbi:hypothetical protein ACRAVF_25975 [Bradyrhizobium oligotrophicum S58]
MSVKTTEMSAQRFEQGNGLIGVDGFDDLETEVSDHVGGIGADKTFVLDDQHTGFTSERRAGHCVSCAMGLNRTTIVSFRRTFRGATR